MDGDEDEPEEETPEDRVRRLQRLNRQAQKKVYWRGRTCDVPKGYSTNGRRVNHHPGSQDGADDEY